MSGAGQQGQQQAAGQQGGAQPGGVARVGLRGTNKPPQYSEDGGFDLYRAQLRSFLTQRECWGIITGDIVRDQNDAAQQQIYDEKNTFVCDTLLRGLLQKDSRKIYQSLI
ncbi:hypothetical protein AM587_10005416 [Phytophthora nicotianae]|uniref:Uncharacterized protein n=2 Tax=Phytophthora nicotianae TaxID=4792 RepID=W2IKI3_PHYNI|nr:hypothetical protein L916_13185 [Phytophthora nicotianae]ETO69795.1 hypothetical protein F444_13684 [Phytophthora nicotianae P1976]KUF78746.1 hypothetical protein AM587_10005416 [Phytophthora nicotianae]